MLSVTGDSLDEILHEVYTKLIDEGVKISGPAKGPNREVIGVTIELADPRARLSRSYSRGRAFSAVGELAWYLAGSDDVQFIHHYLRSQPYKDLDVDGVLRGAYGPRLMGDGIDNQIERIIEMLRTKPTSRQAVIQLFDRRDLTDKIGDLPCTCVLQFFVREGNLEALVYMRSNDAYLGLPHDLFCFTMLQELIARALQVGLGRYIHMVGSLHLYDKHLADAQNYLTEGVHKALSMPPMPSVEPWAGVQSFIEHELRIRTKTFGKDDLASLGNGYWDDLTRMVIGANTSPQDVSSLVATRESLGDKYFAPYFRDRESKTETVGSLGA
jgi:thymidylate synthase